MGLGNDPRSVICALDAFADMSLEWTRCIGFDSGNKMCRARNFHTATLVGDYLYIIGGTDSESFFSDVKKICLRESGEHDMTARWDIPSLQAGDTIPTIGGGAFAARSRHTAVAIGTNIYVFGGVKGGSDLWCFDTTKNPMAWKVVKTTGRPPSARLGHTATSFEGKMYLFGGTDGVTDFNGLWEFNERTAHWSELSGIKGTPPPASPNYTLHALGSNLVAIGCAQADRVMQVYLVNLVGEKRWWDLSAFRSPFNAPPRRHLFTSAPLYSNEDAKSSSGSNPKTSRISTRLKPQARDEPYKILIFGGTIAETKSTDANANIANGLSNECYLLEFHEDAAGATLGATAEFRVKWIRLPSVGRATSKDTVLENVAKAAENPMYWRQTPCPRIGHAMVFFPNLTRHVLQRKPDGSPHWLEVPVKRIYTFGGSDRKFQFADLHFADLEPSFHWQLSTQHFELPDVWPAARLGSTLVPILPRGELKGHQALYLLLGGVPLKTSKHLKSGTDAVGLARKPNADGAYVLYRGSYSDVPDSGGGVTNTGSWSEWCSMKLSPGKSLENSPLASMGFHGHTITPMYDEKGAFSPENSHSCSFLIFGGLVKGTPGVSALWHLSINTEMLVKSLTSKAGTDYGKWSTWKPVKLESKSNKLGTSRMGHAAICFGRTLYVVGGFSDGAYQENGLALNTGSEKLRWRQLHNPVFARVGHSLTTLNAAHETALLFGGIRDGSAFNDVHVVHLAKDEGTDGSDRKRGRTEPFAIQGGAPPSPRFGHAAIRLETYHGIKSVFSSAKHAFHGSQKSKRTVAVASFESDVETSDDGEEDCEAREKAIKAEVNAMLKESQHFYDSVKVFVVGGFVPSEQWKRADGNETELMDIHVLDVSTACWSSPLLLPSVDVRWKKIDYEYVCNTLYRQAHAVAAGKVARSRKKETAEGAGEPSSEDMAKVLKAASSTSSSEVSTAILRAYAPLKNLCTSRHVREKVVLQMKKGQVDSFKRAVKTLALDVQLETNNGRPTFLPSARSRFGACAVGSDSILVFGGVYNNSVESRCLWTFSPSWASFQHGAHGTGKHGIIGSRGGGSSSEQEDSFYSTESDYATDGGAYSSADES